MPKNKVLVTGGTGFIGKHLVKKFLKNKGWFIKIAVRRYSNEFSSSVRQLLISDISSKTNWSAAVENVDVVVHCAARAHVLSKEVSNLPEQFQETNTFATLALAKQCIEANVKRFVYISSIGVNGSNNSYPFTESEQLAPESAYAQSKFEAEMGLMELTKNSCMDLVIIRPPLVYGQGAPGNFASLLRWVRSSIPLPLGIVNNKRSFIAIDNLADFINLCTDRHKSPKAANQVFVISDDEDVSTTDLLKKIAKAYGKKQWLIPVPVAWMKLAAKLVGKTENADKLFGNLQVDCSKAKTLLGWKPVITMDEQLKKMADAER